MLNAILVVGAVVGALQAIRAKRLLVSALWLAGCSAMVSILFYAMEAREMAVIELSVGAGLVTVLFVFAISIAGEDTSDVRAFVPKPLAWALVLISIGLLGWMIIPTIGTPIPSAEPSFSEVLWQQRGLDVIVQSGLMFAGIVGLLGLLADAKVPAKETAVQKQAATSIPTSPKALPQSSAVREEAHV